ncbi:MAG: UDP-3-O-(3-hydroxymyristoyl)glucosamine N-acyltransferase [Oceanococcus sp.]
MGSVGGKTWRLSELAQQFGLELVGADLEISGVCALSPGQQGCVAFVQSDRYADAIAQTQAAAVIVPRKLNLSAPCSVLQADHAQLAFAQVAGLFVADDRPDPGIAPSAVVHPDAHLEQGVRVGPNCSIAAGARIGANSSIGAGSVVGRDAFVGPDADIAARVVIADRVEIGARVLILPGAVVGARGFGNVHDGKRWHAMPQMGTVKLGDDVEIGANTVIDRGALGDTLISDNVRIDNLCQIAHNVQIGAGTALASGVGIAGSTRIGANCMLGGQVGVNGHIEICDGTIINGGSNVLRSITESGQYSSGVPLMPAMAWRRFMAVMGRLDSRLKQLERGRNRD